MYDDIYFSFFFFARARSWRFFVVVVVVVVTTVVVRWTEFRCKAAVAWAANEPLKVEEIEVAPPQKGEVRVKVVANALVRRRRRRRRSPPFMCWCTIIVSLCIPSKHAFFRFSPAPCLPWLHGMRMRPPPPCFFICWYGALVRLFVFVSSPPLNLPPTPSCCLFFLLCRSQPTPPPRVSISATPTSTHCPARWFFVLFSLLLF